MLNYFTLFFLLTPYIGKCSEVNRALYQALYQVNWSTILSNKDVHQQVNILNSIILNVSQTMYLTKLLQLMIKIRLE